MIKNYGILLVTFLIIFSENAFSQNDSIFVDYSFWGNDYFIDGKEYSRGEIKDILDSNPLTWDLIGSSSLKRTIGFIALPAGLILSYYTFHDIVSWYYNKSEGPNWVLPVVLAFGLDLTGIFFIANGNKTFQKAIKLYNKNLTAFKDESKNKLNLNLGFNRIFLSYEF